jgi:hypothetical protein
LTSSACQPRNLVPDFFKDPAHARDPLAEFEKFAMSRVHQKTLRAVVACGLAEDRNKGRRESSRFLGFSGPVVDHSLANPLSCV